MNGIKTDDPEPTCPEEGCFVFCFGHKIECLNGNKHKSKRQVRGKKVLLRGKTGMGKTTFSKMLALEWAKGKLQMFTIVFFVALKLVHPKDTIETIIMNQIPILEGLKCTRQNLGQVLNEYGSRCLIILDGLDDNADRLNQDVLKVVEGRKLLNCNILAIAGNHVKSGIKNHFQTILSVNGFTKDKAREFAAKMLTNRKKVEAVLDFNPLDRQGPNLWESPIILSFLCHLVCQENINLSSKRIHTGEIYFKMIRWICTAYKKRHEKECTDSVLMAILNKLGKFALDTLLQHESPAFPRSEQVNKIGSDGLHIGLLTGHDYSSVSNPSAEISVAFLHTTIQDFFGAFYFIWMLSHGSSVKYLLRDKSANPIFLTNGIFLHFCLWFLSKSNRFIRIPKKSQVTELLHKHSVGFISSEVLSFNDVAQRFPSLDVLQIHDPLRVLFLKKTLKLCPFSFMLNIDDGLSACLSLVQLVLNKVTSINVQDVCTVNCLGSLGTFIRYDYCVQDGFEQTVDTILQNVTNKAQLQVAKHTADNFVLSEVLHKDLLGLSLGHIDSQKSRVISSIVPSCPSLTHLCIFNQTIDPSVMQALSEAVQDDLLPSLNHLSFIKCKRIRYVKSKKKKRETVSSLGLSGIFKSSCPQIRYLNLCDTTLGKKDLTVLSETSRMSLLPSLQSLFITVNSILHPNKTLKLLWANPLNSLTTFYLDDPDRETFMQFTEEIVRGKFPNLNALAILQKVSNERIDPKYLRLKGLKFLRHLTLHRFIPYCDDLESLTENINRAQLRSLDISHGPRVSQSLDLLLRFEYLSLSNLILSDCDLYREDLCSLAQANVEDRLPCLKHLDISHNFVELKWLFYNSCAWNNLRSLNVAKVYHKSDYEDNLSKIMPSGCLRSLEEFSISKEYYKKLGVRLKKLKMLQVHIYHTESIEDISREVEKGLLPALSTVCIKFSKGKSGCRK